ncbi:MAG: hypothetical protein ACRD16_09010 [Thermoanaerobaculia bacterium]
MRKALPWIVILAIAWFLWSGDGDPLEGLLNTLDQLQGRGARVTRAPADAEGYVAGDPSELAEEAGVSLDVYAAARMIASEETHSDRPTKIAICWCLFNEAARRGKTVSAVLLYAKNPVNRGHFGSQKDLDPDSDNYKNSDRYASTRLDPYDEELVIAQAVASGEIRDPTGGCQQYDRPAGEANPQQVAANRIQSGAELVDVPGTDPGLRFWRT